LIKCLKKLDPDKLSSLLKTLKKSVNAGGFCVLDREERKMIQAYFELDDMQVVVAAALTPTNFACCHKKNIGNEK